eukprot:8201788-Alexandrium_andersonii.AAC.1
MTDGAAQRQGPVAHAAPTRRCLCLPCALMWRTHRAFAPCALSVLTSARSCAPAPVATPQTGSVCGSPAPHCGSAA